VKRPRVVVLFEGRDAAGKGGVINCIAGCLNPRVCRVVALGVPTDRQRTQLHCVTHLLSCIPYKDLTPGRVKLPARIRPRLPAPHFLGCTTISTRRLLARPSGVALSPMGRPRPKPCEVIRSPAMPRETR
jgi:hypothetical protein